MDNRKAKIGSEKMDTSYSEIMNAVIRKGSITIYSDTDKEIQRRVIAHNEQMKKNREERKRLQNFEYFYTTVDVIFSLVVLIITFRYAVDNLEKTFIFMALQLFSLIMFAGAKKNFWVATGVQALLVGYNLLYFLLLAANIFMSYSLEKQRHELSSRQCYPDFYDIQVSYSKGETPQGYEIVPQSDISMGCLLL